jgi:hypothetical protein
MLQDLHDEVESKMSDNLNLHLWVARRAEQGTLQAQADYVVEQIKLLEQAVKYEADLAQQALDSRAELAAALDSQIEWVKTLREKLSVSEAKLAKTVQGLEDALEVGMAYSDDRLGYDGAISLLNGLKGEQDD